MTVVNVSRTTVGGLTVAVIHNRDVAYSSWRRAVSGTRTPTIGVGASGKDRRAIADGVESVQVRIVVTAAVVIVIAVAVWVVAPLRTAGTDKD